MAAFLKGFKGFNIKKDEHCKWATSYLSKVDHYAFLTISNEFRRDQLISKSDSFLCSLAGHEVLSKMKDAWSKKLSRAGNNTKKPYNFVMDKSIEKKLRAIAKLNNKTINETVQLLIEERFKQDTIKKERGDAVPTIANFMCIEPPARHPTDDARRKNRPAQSRGQVTLKKECEEQSEKYTKPIDGDE